MTKVLVHFERNGFGQKEYCSNSSDTSYTTHKIPCLQKLHEGENTNLNYFFSVILLPTYFLVLGL